MKIFRVLPDPSYAALLPVAAEAFARVLPFDGSPKSGVWSGFGRGGPSFRLGAGGMPSPGHFFALHPGVLAYDGMVADAADREELFTPDGEWLPASLEAPVQELNLLNITACYPCLAEENPPFAGEAASPGRQVFLPGRILDSTLFRTPQTGRDVIYCLAGRGDGNLYEFCQRHGFPGLLFEEVWSA